MGAALARLLRRVDVVVGSTAAAPRVRGLAGPSVQVIIDDRVLDPRAIEMLAALLVRQNGDRAAATPWTVRRHALPRSSDERKRTQGSLGARVRGT